MSESMLPPRWTPRCPALHSHPILRQQCRWKPYEIRLLRYDRVYFVYVLKQLFVQGISGSFWHIICPYCGSNKSAMAHDLARHVKSISILKYGSRPSDTSHTGNEPKNCSGSTSEGSNQKTHRAVSQDTAVSVTKCSTQLLWTQFLPEMTIQLYSSNVCDPLAFH